MLSLLDKTVRTAKWHGKPLPETIKASVKETLNGDFVLTFTYPITDSGLYRELKEDYLVRSPVPVLGHQLFRIKKIIEGDSTLEVTAYHISDDVMTRIVSPFSCEQVACATALSSLVMASKSPLGDFSFTSDIVRNRTYTSDKEQTLYSALLDGKHSIVGTWEGELVRDNLAISIRTNRGQDRGVVISTHYNLKKYQRTKESSQVITRIHATSTFKNEGQKEETNLRVTVDSPLINSYPFINEVSYSNNNLKTRQELIEWASDKFRLEGIDKPKDAIVIEAFELDGQTVHLGDTVTLKSKLHGIDMSKKAIAYDYDPLAETYRTITFDDKASVGSSKSAGSLSNLASNLIEGNQRSEVVSIEVALENANRAFEAEFDKRKVAIDDAIEQAQSHGEVYADRIKASIDSDISVINQKMRTHEAENNRTFQDILAKSGANTSLANEAKLKAEQAQTGASQALRRAEQAKVDAIQEANRLTTIERNQTETKIASAKTQAIAEASRLVDLAKSLLTGQIATATTSINQTKEDIKLLASKQLVDSLTGRVTSAESTIRQQGEQISQRVKSSDFDFAKQRLTSAETLITHLGNRITTEIIQVEGKIPTAFDGLNLMTGTRDWSDKGNTWHHGSNWHIESEEFRGLKVRSTQHGYNGSHQNIAVKNGDVITFSFFARASQPLENVKLSSTWTGSPVYRAPVARVAERDETIAVTQFWKRYSKTVHVLSDGSLQFRTEYGGSTIPNGVRFFVAGLKVAKSSVDTGYSDNPADTVSEIESVRTVINQTANGVEQISTRLTEASGKLSTAETAIRQLVNDVSSKVSQLDFNNVKRTVDSHTTSITQTSQSILLKADKIFVDGVKTTADAALSKANTNGNQITQTKADLKVTSDAVKTKVSKTDFNNLTGRMTNAETSIRTQAGQIEQRLTSTQVESAISSKGYQTKAQVDSNIVGRGYITNSALTPYATTTILENKVRETSDSFSRMISETKTLIPRGEENLVEWGNPTDGYTPYPNSSLTTHTFFYNNNKKMYIIRNTSSTAEKTFGLNRFMVERNTDYTLYFKGFNNSSLVSMDVWFLKRVKGSTANFDSAQQLISNRKLSIASAEDIVVTFNTGNFDEGYIRFDNNKSTVEGHSADLYIGDISVKKGKSNNAWSPSLAELVGVRAFNEVKSTVDSHVQTIGSVQGNLSQVIQTANGIVTRVGNLESSRATTTAVNAIQTQMSTLAGSWSIRNLTSAGTVLSQLNLNKDGSVKIDGKLVQITGTTYIQDGVIASGKIASLDAGKITTGIISAARIGAEAITADKLKVDQAFFTKFMATEAYLKQLFAKSAFITQVQSVTLSANKISGGILSAINGAMKINLSLGNIKFYTNSPSISREVSGYPHQWVSFETGTSNGKPCGVTIIGSNRWNNWNANDGGFVGIRAWNGTDTDQIDVVGDKVRLASAPYTNPDGWEIVTLPNRLSIDAFKASDRPSSILNIGDIRIYRNGTTYVSLKDVLHQFNHNFKHLVNITGRGDVILTWDTIK